MDYRKMLTDFMDTDTDVLDVRIMYQQGRVNELLSIVWIYNKCNFFFREHGEKYGTDSWVKICRMYLNKNIE